MGSFWEGFVEGFGNSWKPGTAGSMEDKRRRREQQDLEIERLKRERDAYPEDRAYLKKSREQQDQEFERRQKAYDQQDEEYKRTHRSPENDPNWPPPGYTPGAGGAADPGPGSHDTAMMISDPTPNPGLAGDTLVGRMGNDYFNQTGDAAKNYVWPVSGVYTGGGSAYGAGRYKRLHSGIDIKAADGTMVRAAYPGTVVGSKYSPGGEHTIGYRGEVLVKGNDGYVYRYAMHGDRLVHPGDVVNAGDPLGTVANGHLHWEIVPPGSPAYRSMAAGNFVPTKTYRGVHPTLDPAQFFGMKPGESMVGGQPMVLHGGGGADALTATSGIPAPTNASLSTDTGSADTGYDPVSRNPELQGRPELIDELRMLQDRNAQKGLPAIADPNADRGRGNPPMPVPNADTGYDAAANPELRGQSASTFGPPGGGIPTPRLRPDNAPVAAAVPTPRLRPANAPTADAAVNPSGRGNAAPVTPGVTTAPTPQSPVVDAAVRRGSRGLARLSDQDRQAVIDVAGQFGISPQHLLSVIGYETIGTYNPDIMSPTGYMGLIQFGPREQKAFGVRKGMTFAEQLRGPVAAYLRQRGLRPGMGLPELYSIINAGSLNKNGEPRWGAHDAPGHDLRYHLKLIANNFAPGARQFLGMSGAVGLEGQPVPSPRSRPGAIATPASAPANAAPPAASSAPGDLPPAGSDAYDTWLSSIDVGHEAIRVGMMNNLGIAGTGGADTLAGSDTGASDVIGGGGFVGEAPVSPVDAADAAVAAGGAGEEAAIPAPGTSFDQIPPAPPGTDVYEIGKYIADAEKLVDPNNEMPEAARHLRAVGMAYNYFLGRDTRAAMGIARDAVYYFNDRFNTYQATAEAAVEAGDMTGAVKATVEALNSIPNGVTYSIVPRPDGTYRLRAQDEKGAVIHEQSLTKSEIATQIMGADTRTFYDQIVRRAGGHQPSQQFLVAIEKLHKTGTLSREDYAGIHDPQESAYLRAQENIEMRGSALETAAAEKEATKAANKSGLAKAQRGETLTTEEYAAMDPTGRAVVDKIEEKDTRKKMGEAVTEATEYYKTNHTLTPELETKLGGFEGGMDAFEKARAGVDASAAAGNAKTAAANAEAEAARKASDWNKQQLGPARELTADQQKQMRSDVNELTATYQDNVLFPGVDQNAIDRVKATIATAVPHIYQYNQDISQDEAAEFALAYIQSPGAYTVVKHIPGDEDHTLISEKGTDRSWRIPYPIGVDLAKAHLLTIPPPAIKAPEYLAPTPTPRQAEPFVAPQPDYLPGAGGEMFPTPPARTIRPEPFAGPYRP